MTEESDLFCMLLSICPVTTACFRLRTEAAAGREKIFPDGVFLLFRGPEICYHTQ